VLDTATRAGDMRALTVDTLTPGDDDQRPRDDLRGTPRRGHFGLETSIASSRRTFILARSVGGFPPARSSAVKSVSFLEVRSSWHRRSRSRTARLPASARTIVEHEPGETIEVYRA
jgi:hypothetical protein